MTYTYNSAIRLGMVSLNVKDLTNMTNFYTEIIGLSILSQDDNKSLLTFDGKEAIIELRLVNSDQEATYGLYHTAILVPNRNALGLALRQILVTQAPLDGAADHGYSEAIYISDPEGNGVEIYRDKDVSEWDVKEDGQIIGVTDPMDGQSMLDNLTEIPEVYKLDPATIIGHVHLSVHNALASSQLYQKVFQMGNKMTIPTASWIASGQYHHHLAFNNWGGPSLQKHQESNLGLNYLTIEYSDQIFFDATFKKAQLHGMIVIEKEKNNYLLEDLDGIRTHVTLVK
ncbi:VOC family protein [Streptococcus parauberis]|uniref:Glyoxalase family protein n=1 Tax=Streptococcus parauberis NCFD 2020 TaxID=873447 RepID=F1Z1R4_9STRE|nr:VOC family protein [Streptococcus parauberis]EGE54249.1 glyoxalase family protein [Streptococcus parauberis NCFD 2020]EMF48712.1 Glyoxalase family protein [Streptococcus parauberis KRS-02109]PIA83723.1 Catechol-2,3-dioxygenase [Streptococcus parauberis]RFE01138.1 Catechol-2,3-dioxygenase [Streptococcus parauberis]UWM86904.1 VOC family protein [Streptococcus parauberis]